LNRRSSFTPIGLILIGVGLAMMGGTVGGSLSAAVRAAAVQYAPAADRATQARAVAALFGASAARLADGSFNALEAHQHVLDGVQTRLPAWGPAINAIRLEVIRRAGDTPDLAAVRKAFLEAKAGLESVQ